MHELLGAIWNWNCINQSTYLSILQQPKSYQVVANGAEEFSVDAEQLGPREPHVLTMPYGLSGMEYNPVEQQLHRVHGECGCNSYTITYCTSTF